MTEQIEKQFQEAVTASGNLAAKPDDNEMLELYGLYKQATSTQKHENADKPGMFDLKGKAKFNAWGKVSTMNPNDAKKQYAEVVKRLEGKYGKAPAKK